jgi:sugar lactone lactonase YvrE
MLSLKHPFVSLALGTSLAASLAACGDFPCDPEARGTICTVVGAGEEGFAGDEGPATEAQLYTPQDTAISPDGELWVIDFNNYLIRAVDDQGIIRTVIGSGLLGDSPAEEGVDEVPALQADMNHTPSMFFHDGYLYMAAWHNSRVKRVDLSTMMIQNFAGAGRRTYYTGDGGPALEAALDLPSSIASDPDGNVVIMDQANQVIRMVDQDGMMHRLAGSCVVELEACADGEPYACTDSNKTACGDNVGEACAQPCTPGYGGDGGPALEARMAQPYGQMADPAGRLAYDADGNLIFADSNNHRIRRIDKDGIIETIAGTGEAGYSGDGGPATEASMNNPVDVAVAEDGSIYFTDVYNSCVRKIDSSGEISTAVGICSDRRKDWRFDGDGGPPDQARLNRPYGIDLVGPNKMYVADSYNNRIRVVNF